MAIGARFLGGPSILTVQGGGSTVKMTEFRSRNFNIGMNVIKNTASGAITPTFVGTMGTVPAIDFETFEIKRFLDAVSLLEGASIGADATYDAFSQLDTYWVQRQIMGASEVTDGHLKGTADRGLVMASRIQATARQEATLSGMIHLASTTGTDSPMSFTDDQALPANAYEVDQKYQLGPVTLQGADFDDVESVTLNVGYTAEPLLAEADLYPTGVAVTAVVPTIEIAFYDVEKLLTYNFDGVAISGTCRFYLRAKVKGANVVANATTSHLRFVVNAGMIEMATVTDGQGNAKPGLRIHPALSYSGSTLVAPITYTSGLAIS